MRRVGFGLGRLHHLALPSQRERIVLGAFDAGCTHFDVAPAYGDGLCEAEAGRILRHHRHSLTIGTKFGIPCSDWGARSSLVYYGRTIARKFFSPNYGAEYAKRSFDAATAVKSLHESLVRLRTDYVDHFFVHEPRHLEDFATLSQLTGALEKLRSQGKIRQYGVAGRSPLFLQALERGLTFGDCTQFELAPESEEVARSWPSGSYFAYGLFRSEAPTADLRLDYRTALDRFFSRYPAVTPLVATTRADALPALRRAIAA